MQMLLEDLRKKPDVKLLKQSFFYTYLLGLAAHAYGFLNLTISHDSLRAFYIAGKWPKASLGRIFYAGYITLTRGKIVLPWLIGILALFWASLAVYLILQLFQIKERQFVLLLSGICVTNPSVYALAATYLHDLDANFFAILLAVLSVCLWKKGSAVPDKKQGGLLLILGAFLASVMLGIYQCFLSVTIVLIMLISIKELFGGNCWKEVFVKGILGVFMVGLSGIFYMIEVKVFTHFTGISVMDNNEYNGLGNLSQTFSGNLFEKIAAVYESFGTAFKNVITVSDTPGWILVIHGILLLCALICMFAGMKKKKAGNTVLFVLLGILLPFSMNLSAFLSNGMYHVLMQYAVWFSYLLILLLVWWCIREKRLPDRVLKTLQAIVIVCLLAIILENIQTSNAIYVKKDLEAQSTLSFMTRVADRMEEQEDYIPGETPVVLIGEYAVGHTMTGFEKYEVITGVEYHSPITFYDTYKDYFRYVLGRPITLADASEMEKREEVLDMPVFPKEGSIAMIDGTLVVKLQ